jgi:hypothetical protein
MSSAAAPLLPQPREFVQIYHKIRSCFNLVGALGPWLTEPYPAPELVARLVEYLMELVGAQRNFDIVKTVRNPLLSHMAMARIKAHIANQNTCVVLPR